MPISRKYFDMCRWWTEWNELARRVPTLGTAQMIEQFDSVMLKYATYFAKKLLEFDVAGKNFDLEKRWNYIANKLKGEAYVS